MESPSILVTGGYGCIGAETVKWLSGNTDADIIVASRSVSDERTARIFHGIDSARLRCVPLDVSDKGEVDRLFAEQRITHVVHMAAFQTPDCNAYRDRGLQINLAGTQHLIEAMKAGGQTIKRFVYASSVAVYGPRVSYPAGQVPMLSEPCPVNVYGAWKLAGEHISRIFWEDTSIPTLSLRPGVLFGPGRDAGLTSTPTTAMKALALGMPYEIPYRSKQDYQYAPDVGAAVGNATVEPFEGYNVFTLPGLTLETAELVDTLRDVAAQLGLSDQFAITVGSNEVPFICELEFAPFLAQFPDSPQTALFDALKQSVEVFREQVARGWLTPDNVA